MSVTGQNRESREKEKDWIQVACHNGNPRSALVFAVQTHSTASSTYYRARSHTRNRSFLSFLCFSISISERGGKFNHVSSSSSYPMGDGEELVSRPNHHHVLRLLRLLEDASHHFHTNNSPTKLLTQIETELGMFVSSDPRLSTLSSYLSQLKVLVQTQEESKSKHRIRSFFTNKIRALEISRLSRLIRSEIQAWSDRQNLEELAGILRERFSNSDSTTSSSSTSTSSTTSWDEESLIIEKLSQLRDRLGRGFDIHFQDDLLKSRIYSLLELLLGRTSISKRVREMAAYTLRELVLFNKDVFVGQVLVGQTIKSLVTMGSMCGLDVLKSLIKAIKSPLVDELDLFGGILKIVQILGDDYRSTSSELGLRVMAIDCIMEIGYYGRKEAIESMLNEAGLIKKLVDLQRSEWGGTLIEMEKEENNDNSNSEELEEEEEEKDRLVNLSSSRSKKEKKFLLKHPFASCVARFAVQLEVGEGLRQREKRAFKQEILKRVREASVSDAEAATIIAEVLWGSTP